MCSNNCWLSNLDPVKYGQHLFRVLFDGPIATAYDHASVLARQRSDGRLHVHLLLDERLPGEVHELKWERMCNLQGKPLAISGLTPFSRYTTLPEAEPEPLKESVIRLLFVVSAPKDLEAYHLAVIDVEAGVRRLLGELADVWRSGRCQATLLPGQTELSPELRADLKAAGCEVVRGNATLDNIAGHLTDQHAFHFLGHGQYRDGQGWLMLEGEDGTLLPVADTELATRLGDTPVRLVFLAACESAVGDGSPAAGETSFRGLAASLVQAGIPAVVAMQEQINIEAAYRLTREFYRRLFLEHGMVDRALNEARALLYGQDEQDWGTPVLFMRLKTGQLATANPVRSALRAMREHADYADFRTGGYIPLPLQAVQVSKGRDISLYEQIEPRSIGTLDLIGTILDVYLKSKDAAAQDHASPASLVLVLGGPGASKSTLMKRLGWETIQDQQKQQQEQKQEQTRDFFLPLYLSLEDYRPSGSTTTEALEGQILDRLRLFLPDLAARSLDELSKQMQQVRLRILFSAGDTLPDVGQDLVRQTVRLARDHPRHQYVLAIQPSSLHWDDLREEDQIQHCILAVQPLTQRGIRNFLEAQDEPGQRLLDVLYDKTLFDLASAPFFLARMLTRARKGFYPSSRAAVLQQLIDEAIIQVPADKGMRANALRTLGGMALEMQRKGIEVWPIGEVFRAMSSLRGERGYEVEELYASLVKQKLLVPMGDNAVRFAYRSIQAYCCAQTILALPERDKCLREIVGSLGSPVQLDWWEETLVVTSGLLAADRRAEAQRTLQRLLEAIVYGADLLEGTPVFLGAHCLLEGRPVHGEKEILKLVDHVVNALQWRSSSAFEPDLMRRLQATQLLAQLATPDIVVHLASKMYSSMARKNVAGEWDYEFGIVRFAAAIALKRMNDEDAREALAEINPGLVGLFAAWQRKDFDEVIRQSEASEDLGLQGLATLALGDLHGPLKSGNRPEDARRVLDRLIEMFKSGETRQRVRWAVADSLSLLDSALVTESLVNPLLRELSSPGGKSLPHRAEIGKSLAYLIGLLRLHDEGARNFLVQECLRLEGEEGSTNWGTWATAIVALGRIAAESDKKLLAEIASGRTKGVELRQLFRQEAQRTYIRREAINALANQGDLDVLSPEDRDRLAKEPALSRAYYQAIQEIYWRQVAAARAAQ